VCSRDLKCCVVPPLAAFQSMQEKTSQLIDWNRQRMHVLVCVHVE